MDEARQYQMVVAIFAVAGPLTLVGALTDYDLVLALLLLAIGCVMLAIMWRRLRRYVRTGDWS
jgi:membrane protein implicated in regulation of membrane protease activity